VDDRHRGRVFHAGDEHVRVQGFDADGRLVGHRCESTGRDLQPVQRVVVDPARYPLAQRLLP
jgi:hypothetical protein